MFSTKSDFNALVAQFLKEKEEELVKMRKKLLHVKVSANVLVSPAQDSFGIIYEVDDKSVMLPAQYHNYIRARDAFLDLKKKLNEPPFVTNVLPPATTKKKAPAKPPLVPANKMLAHFGYRGTPQSAKHMERLETRFNCFPVKKVRRGKKIYRYYRLPQ